MESAGNLATVILSCTILCFHRNCIGGQKTLFVGNYLHLPHSWSPNGDALGKSKVYASCEYVKLEPPILKTVPRLVLQVTGKRA